MSNSSVQPLSGATTLGLSEPGCNGNEEVLHFPQSSKTGASPLECLMSYPVHSLEESYLITEMQSVYSTAAADWARNRT